MRTQRPMILLSLSGILLVCILLLLAKPAPQRVLALRDSAPLHATSDVPFFSQTALQGQAGADGLPYRLGNSELKLWEYGCGVASLAMVYRYYGVDTDPVALNASLRNSGAFSGALLDWSDQAAVVKAGNPWIRGVERLNTTRPQDYQPRIDAALARGEPVIAYLNGEHYVVITGREAKDGKVVYHINDPWAVTAGDGQGIALEDNLLHKGGFDAIRQLVFVTAQQYAPTNGILVSAVLSPTYSAYLGSAGSLGNPLAQAAALPDGKGVWQQFDHGAIFGPQGAQPTVLFGPVWEKYRADGGIAKFGVPVASLYSDLVGPAVTWRADFKAAAILWTEGDPASRARVLTPANAFLAEYFANPDLSGAPVYRRLEEDLLFDWQAGAPGPWVKPDGFAARFTGTFQVGGLGWRYNFMAAADNGVRVRIDGQAALDTWTSPVNSSRFTLNLGRGEHTVAVEYRHLQGDAHLYYARSAWPATAVFAAEAVVSPADRVPASAAQVMPNLGTPIARATGTAQAVLATFTAEAQRTPTPDTQVAGVALARFAEWATANGEPYRDVQATVLANDGFFATVHLVAWFRPGASAPWEEREATAECRHVGEAWQCDASLAFALTTGERTRRAQATATAEAVAGARPRLSRGAGDGNCGKGGELGAMVFDSGRSVPDGQQ